MSQPEAPNPERRSNNAILCFSIGASVMVLSFVWGAYLLSIEFRGRTISFRALAGRVTATAAPASAAEPASAPQPRLTAAARLTDSPHANPLQGLGTFSSSAMRHYHRYRPQL